MTDKQQIRFLTKQVEALNAQNALLLEMVNKMRAVVIVNTNGSNNAVNVVTGNVSGNAAALTGISNEAVPAVAHRF